MRSIARAPGKLVALGEYAVLDGAPALVLAIDRFAEATFIASDDDRCHLETRAPDPSRRAHACAELAGVPLVDIVRLSIRPPDRIAPWRATLDTSAFFSADQKLGLGSSAAALCAFAAAWSAYLRSAGASAPAPSLERLTELHRSFQGGSGSGLDVAASVTGGVIEYRLERPAMPRVGSVQLPNGVGFAGIFAGRSASTPELLARYRSFCAEHPKRAAEVTGRLQTIAEAGCAAARGDDAGAFIAAIRDYDRGLRDLGIAMRAEIVTAEHRRIGDAAERFGVAYKVSGAGGGDLGIAFAADPRALARFKTAVSSSFQVIDLRVAAHGLIIEERE